MLEEEVGREEGSGWNPGTPKFRGRFEQAKQKLALSCGRYISPLNSIFLCFPINQVKWKQDCS